VRGVKSNICSLTAGGHTLSADGRAHINTERVDIFAFYDVFGICKIMNTTVWENVAWWLSGYGTGFVIERSRVLLLAGSLPTSNEFG